MVTLSTPIKGDGNPLPSFEGEPELITIESPTAQAFADLLWESLNGDNKVSLFVRYIDLATGETDDVIVNKPTSEFNTGRKMKL